MVTTKGNYVIAARTRTKKVVTMFVTPGEVGIRIKFADFLDDLLAEVGSVTFAVSTKAFQNRVKAAAETVMSRYKTETVAIADKVPVGF
jgi:transketolase